MYRGTISKILSCANVTHNGIRHSYPKTTLWHPQFYDLSQNLDPSLRRLLESCLTISTKERISTSDILSDLYFTDIDIVPAGTDEKALLFQCPLSHIYYWWQLAGGDVYAELKNEGLIRSEAPILIMPRFVSCAMFFHLAPQEVHFPVSSFQTGAVKWKEPLPAEKSKLFAGQSNRNAQLDESDRSVGWRQTGSLLSTHSFTGIPRQLRRRNGKFADCHPRKGHRVPVPSGDFIYATVERLPVHQGSDRRRSTKGYTAVAAWTHLGVFVGRPGEWQLRIDR